MREAPGGELITLTVLLPNKSKGLGKGETFLRQNLSSVARIRRASGADFFPELSAAFAVRSARDVRRGASKTRSASLQVPETHGAVPQSGDDIERELER